MTSKYNTMKSTINKNREEIPSIEEQVEQSLKDIKAGRYKEYTIPEYLEELKRRFGKDLDD